MGFAATMCFAIIAGRETETNARLAGAGVSVLSPREAACALRPGDVALARLDVRSTLDGIEPGLEVLDELERRGVLVLNPSRTLIASHDKLVTARALAAAGVVHPATRHVYSCLAPGLETPFVLKPRFGSWGRDVVLCPDREDARRALGRLQKRGWFRQHGALAQELVPPLGRDVRILVAGGRVVGAVQRIATVGEWRTNVALGAVRRPIVPSREARRLALAAAAAVGGDLLGVDLLPVQDAGFVVLEVNGAVEFTLDYSLGRDAFSAVRAALERVIAERACAVRPRVPAAVVG